MISRSGLSAAPTDCIMSNKHALKAPASDNFIMFKLQSLVAKDAHRLIATLELVVRSRERGFHAAILAAGILIERHAFSIQTVSHR